MISGDHTEEKRIYKELSKRRLMGWGKSIRVRYLRDINNVPYGCMVGLKVPHKDSYKLLIGYSMCHRWDRKKLTKVESKLRAIDKAITMESGNSLYYENIPDKIYKELPAFRDACEKYFSKDMNSVLYDCKLTEYVESINRDSSLDNILYFFHEAVEYEIQDTRLEDDIPVNRMINEKDPDVDTHELMNK